MEIMSYYAGSVCERASISFSKKQIVMSHLNNHQELYQKVSLYLDNALSADEQLALMQEINSNPHSLELLSKEQRFRDFVKARTERRTASPALIQAIKEKIRIAPA